MVSTGLITEVSSSVLRKWCSGLGKTAVIATHKPTALKNFETAGLKYAPAVEGDVMSLSPQARKAAERIKELKSRVADDGMGNLSSYDDFARYYPNKSEDWILFTWRKLLDKCSHTPKNQIKCLEEINKCFQIENMSKIEFFKNLTKEEKELLQQFKDKVQLISVITGHKPAYFGKSKDGVINFAKAINGTKYADEFIAINVKSNPKHFCILNKKQVREVVENNKEIYCRELGLDINTPTEEVYQKWLKCIENEYPSEEKPLAFGLTLGYPKWSSLIYSLEKGVMQHNNELLKLLQNDYLINNQKTQEAIIKAIRHEKSPLKSYSEKFKKDFEKYIKTEDLRRCTCPDGGDFYYHCSIYGSESAHMEKVLKEEADFINNFRMEQLF